MCEDCRDGSADGHDADNDVIVMLGSDEERTWADKEVRRLAGTSQEHRIAFHHPPYLTFLNGFGCLLGEEVSDDEAEVVRPKTDFAALAAANKGKWQCDYCAVWTKDGDVDCVGCDNWKCPCGTQNKSSEDTCSKCSAARPEKKDSSSSSSAAPSSGFNFGDGGGFHAPPASSGGLPAAGSGGFSFGTSGGFGSKFGNVESTSAGLGSGSGGFTFGGQ